MSRLSFILLIVVAIVVLGLISLGFSTHERPLAPVEKAMLNEAVPAK